MQFLVLSAIAMASFAVAMPAAEPERQVIAVSLPPGCTDSDLAKCALHLIGTTGSCGAAIIEGGLDPAADLACIGSAASTANNFSECKSCIPS